MWKVHFDGCRQKKPHPNNGNDELLEIASPHLFCSMLGPQIPPLSTAPDGFTEIIICCWFFPPQSILLGKVISGMGAWGPRAQPPPSDVDPSQPSVLPQHHR